MFTVFIALIYVCFKSLSLLLGFLLRSVEFGDVKCLWGFSPKIRLFMLYDFIFFLNKPVIQNSRQHKYLGKCQT